MKKSTIEPFVRNSDVEKTFTLRFLKENPSIDEKQNWIWDPEQPQILNIKTATFSGKNKADDYTNE